jgi:SAM-dependent methyltransferase
MSNTNYKGDILNFYNQFLSTSDINSSQAVAWTNKESQEKRFEVLFDIGISKDDTKFLDLGCGLGHLVDYMKKNEYGIKNYVGVDINPHYIFFANLRNPDADFKIGEIYDIKDNYDYVIGSGNFTVKMPINEIFDAIAKAYEIANKGVAFNFLTYEFFGNEDKDFNCFIPEEFFDMVNKIYPKTRLITNYLGNEDFTIYIYK